MEIKKQISLPAVVFTMEQNFDFSAENTEKLKWVFLLFTTNLALLKNVNTL